jgi:alkylhydroperoxidase family enzyme
MPRIKFSSVGETPFQKLLGHNEDVQKKWSELEEVFYNSNKLSSNLKEQLRRVLAHGNGCEYCMARGKPDPESYDVRTSVAVAFGEMFVNHRSSINQATFDVLKGSFSEDEISELVSFICFTTASHTFGALMELKPLND